MAVAQVYATVEGEGRPVVLLHAGGLDSRMFDLDLARMARSARVLRYDRSGSGRSPAANAAVDRVEELRLVSAATFGPRPVVLVGSSFGGQLAIDFALAHPRLVAGLLLIGPGLSGAELSEGRRARMAGLVAAARRGGDEFADAWLADPHLAPDGLPPSTRELSRAMLRDNVGLLIAPAPSVAPASAVGRLDRLTAAGLVIVGERDDADNHAIAGTLAREAPALALRRVPRAGHFPLLERVGWLPEMLDEVLARLDR